MAQTGPSQAGAPRASSDARGLGQREAMDGEEAPVLSECGSWGNMELGSIFSVFQ